MLDFTPIATSAAVLLTPLGVLASMLLGFVVLMFTVEAVASFGEVTLPSLYEVMSQQAAAADGAQNAAKEQTSILRAPERPYPTSVEIDTRAA